MKESSTPYEWAGMSFSWVGTGLMVRAWLKSVLFFRTADRPTLAAGFQVTLHVQVDLAELVEGLGVGGLPQAAGGGLEQALGDAAQRPGVGLPHERAGLFVEDVGRGQLLVHPVRDDAGGGVVAEQVVHGRGELERPFVPVTAHRRYPARVYHPGAEHPPGLLGQRAR